MWCNLNGCLVTGTGTGSRGVGKDKLHTSELPISACRAHHGVSPGSLALKSLSLAALPLERRVVAHEL